MGLIVFLVLVFVEFQQCLDKARLHISSYVSFSFSSFVNTPFHLQYLQVRTSTNYDNTCITAYLNASPLTVVSTPQDGMS